MPKNTRRRAYRRFSDERIWREFYSACIIATASHKSIFNISEEAAKLADEAYAEYRSRFPVREPELDDETPADKAERPQ